MRFYCFFFLKEILDWRTSREFFYWRLKRRLGEDQIIKTILSNLSSADYQSSLNQLEQWFNDDKQDEVKIFSFEFSINRSSRLINGSMTKLLFNGLNN